MPITQEPSQITLAMAEQILDAQPFNAVVGARIARFAPGEAELELVIADHHRQQFGVVHGGVLAYLVDNTLTFACGSVLGAKLLTSGMTVSYLAAARDGLLRARASVTGRHGRHAVATVTVEEIAPDGQVRVCAVGQGTAAAITRTPDIHRQKAAYHSR